MKPENTLQKRQNVLNEMRKQRRLDEFQKKIDNNNWINVNLLQKANIIKQPTPNNKSPKALVDILDVDTFKSIFFGVNKLLE